MHKGSCLCGAVTFEVDGDLPAPDACHCRNCRKFSGHFFVSTDVLKSALTIYGADSVSWYQSSQAVSRGFCATCGSSLFWAPLNRDWIGAAMGALEMPTQSHIALHIFVEDKGDYYEITDGLPQYPRIPPA